MTWDLSRKRHVYFICGGKAANATAMALEAVLGDYLTRGVVIVKSLEPEDHFRKCEVFVGGHPLPNTEGFRGCLRILSMVEEANEDDLFISAISGGTSALMACPIEGLTLEEDILTTDILLKSGANIFEINSIRRHISRINGGQLARSIERKGAEMILLMHKDAIGYPATVDSSIPQVVTGITQLCRMPRTPYATMDWRTSCLAMWSGSLITVLKLMRRRRRSGDLRALS